MLKLVCLIQSKLSMKKTKVNLKEEEVEHRALSVCCEDDELYPYFYFFIRASERQKN